MIDSFDDFCLWVYVRVEDLRQQIGPLFGQRGPQAECSDSKTMALVGECREWDKETTLLSNWQKYRALFAHIPSRGRFNRRRRALMNAFDLMRQVVLRELDLSADRQCAIDSPPVSVVKFHLVLRAVGDWVTQGVDFGKVISKKVTIFGFKLDLLVSLGGLILDFELAPARACHELIRRKP
jgi:hypothetical protein